MIKGIIFDMDGVMLDSEPIHGEVVERIFRKYGIDITKEEHEAFIGGTSYAMWSTLADKFDLTISPEQLLAEDQENYLKKLASISDLKPIEGARKVLAFARSHQLVIALASSATRANVDLVLKKLRLIDEIAVTVSGDEVSHSKPHPEIFNTVARKTGINVQEFMVIEDSENGVRAAKQAGMKCIGYINPNSGDQNLESADWIIDNLHEAISILRKNVKTG